ncbi:MAG TPA: LuxR C-terminal-related transcriptional regulator [Gemmatimonadales bacterium]
MEDEAGQEISAGRRHIIERPRLTKLLDETSARVIMLVAPAGYGKTTLARQWLANRPHAWYEATPESADLAVLGVGLCDLTGALTDRVGTRFREWLLTRRTLDTEAAAESLAADLEEWPQDAWLVIDDYHWLSNEAEQVIDRLRGLSTIRVLLTSRRRPAWATARSLLYGEVYEVGQNTLAMSSAEANEVLMRLQGEAAGGLVALADGWPAVIGLASFANPSALLDVERLPPELYAYIADELYDSVQASAQEGLCAISLLSSPSRSLATKLVGSAAIEALSEGVRVGFLTDRGSGAYDMHPLLRTFLRRKLDEMPTKSRMSIAERAATLLIEERSWESAFDAIANFHQTSLLDVLVRNSLYPLLNEGRISLIRRFVEYAQEQGSSGPIFDLAKAELSFLEGFHQRARDLAERATQGLLDGGSLAAKAHFRAGQSAYFSDDPGGAIEHFQAARRLGADVTDTCSAIWGQFVASVEVEDTRAEDFLHEFEASAISTLEDKVRVQIGKLHLGTRLGSVWKGLEGSECIVECLAEAREPTVRASFWQAYTGALRVTSRYPEALAAAERGLQEVSTFRLEFARTHINLAEAAIYIALGRYAEALSRLDDVEAVARARGDVYLQMNERTLRCRLNLLDGKSDTAVRLAERKWAPVPSTGQYAELLACNAIAHHRSGRDRDRLEQLLNQAESTSRENEARHLCGWARAMVLLEEDSAAATTLINATFSEARAQGVLDPFVFACRVEPRILEQVREVSGSSEDVREFLSQVAEGVPAPQPTSVHLPTEVTPREREVLSLLVKGKTNRAIAQELYVSEATVKVHVRHILEKLGVSTRTEAAVLALRKRWLEGSEEEPPRAPDFARAEPRP